MPGNPLRIPLFTWIQLQVLGRPERTWALRGRRCELEANEFLRSLSGETPPLPDWCWTLTIECELEGGLRHEFLAVVTPNKHFPILDRLRLDLLEKAKGKDAQAQQAKQLYQQLYGAPPPTSKPWWTRSDQNSMEIFPVPARSGIHVDHNPGVGEPGPAWPLSVSKGQADFRPNSGRMLSPPSNGLEE